jgi:phage tail-like protein
MSELRPFALVRTGDQWVRCRFDSTFLDPQTGIVELAWTTATADTALPAPAIGAGLAFDNECRLYHSVTSPDGSADRVERSLWKAADPLGPTDAQPPALNLFAGEPDEAVGDFTAAGASRTLSAPCGLAVDVNDRLFIAERGADAILVYDLWSDRLIRRITLPGAQPTDLAVHGTDVYAVLSDAQRIVQLSAHGGPDPFTLPVGCTAPSRTAVSPAGSIAILEHAATAAAHVWFASDVSADFAAPMATDLEWQSETVLVIARRPGADFFRYELTPGQPPAQIASLRGRDYDGLGIIAIPQADACCDSCAATDRQIGYWTPLGLRVTVAARFIFERVGRVTTFQLDSGAYQTTWGRLFVDACIPDGADLKVHYIVTDDPDDDVAMLPKPPANIAGSFVPNHPELSPPLPPSSMAPGPNAVLQRLHLRESGRELPWTQPAADDRFDTYEAPINAPAGRYLWITLELRGNTRVSPKLKCLRAEYPAHDYLRRIPRTFSRDPQVASFLLRYLAMFEGFLGETEARGVDRDLLLDPCSSPDECLPWLASFVGLALDERWATAPSGCGDGLDARRRIIKEVVWLFRYRGTLHGLTRFIELYVGRPVIVIEHYRMRGIGAVTLGEAGALSSSVIGEGFRIGGAVGSDTATAIDGSAEDAFGTHAHRFTVIVQSALTDEQLDVVSTIIDVHRPAHTIFDLCTAGTGMRVGRGLMLAISSVIGPTGGFTQLQIGGSVLGRGAIVGRPAEGGTIGSSRLGADTRIG